jgi:protoheme IX farnesyltransferase
LFKAYYRLTKPGIIYGNLLTAAAGFLFAARWHIHWLLFLSTLIGTALVIASACVINNYIDRGIDKKMARTKRRALAVGAMSATRALIFATVLGLGGFDLLILRTNGLTVLIGAVAFLVYIGLYGYGKRKSVHGTLIGSIAGAAPIVAGYCAVTDRFNGAALLLFLIMAAWQMPHFYAIAMYRSDDYRSAGLPVLPLHKNMQAAKLQIVLYIIAFIVATSLLAVLGYTGYIFLIVMLLIGLAWLYKGLRGYGAKDDAAWARNMFFFSLIVVLVLSVMTAVGPLLP